MVHFIPNSWKLIGFDKDLIHSFYPPVLTGGVGKSEKVLNWGGPGFSKIAGGGDT